MKVILYGPFYLVAIYAFVRQRVWIQPWCLVWAGCVIGTAAPIFMENFYGSLTSEPMLYITINGLPIAVSKQIATDNDDVHENLLMTP